MKLVKFENTGCPSCDRATLFLKSVNAYELATSAMPYVNAEDAILAGKVVPSIMSFPTFVIFNDDNEVVKRMDGFSSDRASELMELVEFYKENL
jgi:thiol-disulfide isomerase/thioredoxin